MLVKIAEGVYVAPGLVSHIQAAERGGFTIEMFRGENFWVKGGDIKVAVAAVNEPQFDHDRYIEAIKHRNN